MISTKKIRFAIFEDAEFPQFWNSCIFPISSLFKTTTLESMKMLNPGRIFYGFPEGFKNIVINRNKNVLISEFTKTKILTINCKDCLYTTAQVIGEKNFKYNQDQRL